MLFIGPRGGAIVPVRLDVSWPNDPTIIPHKIYPVIRIQISATVAGAPCGLCIIRCVYYIASPITAITKQTVVRCRIVLC